MNRQVIERALMDISRSFSPLVIMDSNFCANQDSFSWPNYLAGIPSSLAYALEYQRLIDKKQYSFLLKDKSFFQFYFKFETGTISSARLAYYPAPLRISGAFDDIAEAAEESGIDLLEELYFGAENWIDRGIDVVNTSHLRLDYDSKVTSHCPCHLQFGGLNEFRIPSHSLINPFIFFTWVCENIRTDQLEHVFERNMFKRSNRYHLTRSQEIGQLDNDYPHLVAQTIT